MCTSNTTSTGPTRWRRGRRVVARARDYAAAAYLIVAVVVVLGAFCVGALVDWLTGKRRNNHPF